MFEPSLEASWVFLFTLFFVVVGWGFWSFDLELSFVESDALGDCLAWPRCVSSCRGLLCLSCTWRQARMRCRFPRYVVYSGMVVLGVALADHEGLGISFYGIMPCDRDPAPAEPSLEATGSSSSLAMLRLGLRMGKRRER